MRRAAGLTRCVLPKSTAAPAVPHVPPTALPAGWTMQRGRRAGARWLASCALAACPWVRGAGRQAGREVGIATLGPHNALRLASLPQDCLTLPCLRAALYSWSRRPPLWAARGFTLHAARGGCRSNAVWQSRLRAAGAAAGDRSCRRAGAGGRSAGSDICAGSAGAPIRQDAAPPGLP